MKISTLHRSGHFYHDIDIDIKGLRSGEIFTETWDLLSKFQTNTGCHFKNNLPLGDLPSWDFNIKDWTYEGRQIDPLKAMKNAQCKT